ncbi:MAG: hypothetical protein AAB225_05320 [Acidobacteriota bacterium]
MIKRILLAGLLGGAAMFLASTITHVVLPLGEVGIQSLPNEEAVVPVLRDNIRECGLYFFPGMPSSDAPEQQKKWEDRYRAGPTGILVYHPRGSEPLDPVQLVTELASNILLALVVGWLLSRATLASFGARLLFVTSIGLVVGLAVPVSYWNWYGFPGAYTLAEMAQEVIGFGAAGLILAWRIKP